MAGHPAQRPRSRALSSRAQRRPAWPRARLRPAFAASTAAGAGEQRQPPSCPRPRWWALRGPPWTTAVRRAAHAQDRGAGVGGTAPARPAAPDGAPRRTKPSLRHHRLSLRPQARLRGQRHLYVRRVYTRLNRGSGGADMRRCQGWGLKSIHTGDSGARPAAAAGGVLQHWVSEGSCCQGPGTLTPSGPTASAQGWATQGLCPTQAMSPGPPRSGWGRPCGRQTGIQPLLQKRT